MLSRLNPFRNLPNPREVWAWGMYDLANQSFTLLINTLLFSIFFKEVVVGDDQKGDSLWGLTYSASMLVVVLISPLAGAVADCRGWRKRFLVLTGLGCAALTCALSLASPGAIALAIALYIPANVLYQLGENFLASFLPSVSTPRNVGRVSAIGWTMGYAGALMLLMISVGAILLLKMEAPKDWDPLFLFAGIWFFLNMIPAMIVLREPPTVRDATHKTLAHEAFARLKNTLAGAGQYRQLVRFLTAFFVYGMGVQVIIAFASIIARDFGFDVTKLVLFVLQLTVTAGIASILTARYQDRVGAKNTVMAFLFVWIASCAGMLAMSLINPCPEWAFWIVGNGIGLGIGGIGTSSRSLVARFTPSYKTAEFFGLWGMVYKLAGVVGVLGFSQAKAWIGMPTSFVLLLGFFGVGMILLLRVNEPAGVRAAMRAERDANGKRPPHTETAVSEGVLPSTPPATGPRDD